MTTPVVLRGPRQSKVKTDNDITLIEAPKSNIALSNLVLLIIHETKNIPGSLYYCGILTASFLIKLDMFLFMLTTSLSTTRLLCV